MTNLNFYSTVATLLFVTQTSYAHFPKSFKWCSATAAHQVEGNNIHSDWWEFERIPGNIKNNERSGIAVNQWNLITEDIQKMKAIGLNSYRFSIEWAKVQPAQDKWDLEALKHYKLLVKELKKSGIQPLVTLHHFTLPQWLAEKGGWNSDISVSAFITYSAKVFEALKDDVPVWITFNEPMVLITAGYLDGVFPPKKKGDFQAAFNALKNVLTAHGQTVARLRKMDNTKRARFGFAHHLRVFDPANKYSPLDYFAARELDQIWNWSFTDALDTGRFKVSIPFQASIDVEIPQLIGSQDFFGLNYYTRDMVGFSLTQPFFKRSNPADSAKSDLGWEIYPQGLGILLSAINKKYPLLPILITENGIADAADKYRAEFIKNHLKEIELAIKNKIPVEGYCHWSLLDNFEWAEGFSPRFGLYEVDYSSLGRKPRRSALFFKDFIKEKTSVTQ